MMEGNKPEVIERQRYKVTLPRSRPERHSQTTLFLGRLRVEAPA
jgi:hypothetical protein